jgi:hypothetical protein
MSDKYPQYRQQLLRFGPHDEFPSTENWPMSNAGVTLLHDPADGECRYCAKLVGKANQGEPCDGAAPLRRALWTIAHDCDGWARELARTTLGLGEEPLVERSDATQQSAPTIQDIVAKHGIPRKAAFYEPCEDCGGYPCKGHRPEDDSRGEENSTYSEHDTPSTGGGE